VPDLDSFNTPLKSKSIDVPVQQSGERLPVHKSDFKLLDLDSFNTISITFPVDTSGLQHITSESSVESSKYALDYQESNLKLEALPVITRSSSLRESDYGSPVPYGSLTRAREGKRRPQEIFAKHDAATLIGSQSTTGSGEFDGKTPQEMRKACAYICSANTRRQV
jgi:hypothetical protein